MKLMVCPFCEETSTVNLHYHSPYIALEENPRYQTRSYTAYISYKYVCPYCGRLVEETLRRTMDKDDFIKIIMREE